MNSTSEDEYEVAMVEVTGISIPFWNLVSFLVKLALAAIPASIILAALYWFIFSVLLVALRSI